MVPSLLWVFRTLSTTPSRWRVSSDWPGHCPSPPGFQLVPSLLCQSQQKALSDASPSYEWLLSSSGLSDLPSPIDSKQIELGIFDIRLPPSSAMLSTPGPGSFEQVAGICLFFLSAASSQPSSHSTVNSTRMIFFLLGDHIMMSSLRVVDSTASGKGSFLPRSTSISNTWACRRFCLTWLGTTGLWPSFTKVMVLSSGLALAGCFFLLSCSRMSAPTPCHGTTCISPVSI